MTLSAPATADDLGRTRGLAGSVSVATFGLSTILWLTLTQLLASAMGGSVQAGTAMVGRGDALHVKADRMRDTPDPWVESLRTTVRGNPWVSVAAAIALGAVIARIIR